MWSRGAQDLPTRSPNHSGSGSFGVGIVHIIAQVLSFPRHQAVPGAGDKMEGLVT